MKHRYDPHCFCRDCCDREKSLQYQISKGKRDESKPFKREAIEREAEYETKDWERYT